MTALGEERFRELLDERGILRPGALASPERSASYTVFVQRNDAVLDVPALKQHASRFFGAKLGLTVDKKYGFDPPKTDAARIVLSTDDGTATGTRLCFGRRAIGLDHAAAEAAERLQATHGMALLAQRCPTVWLVVRETEDDRVALTIATILASSMFGPILSPDESELFGVRTGRMKLEGRASPYR